MWPTSNILIIKWNAVSSFLQSWLEEINDTYHAQLFLISLTFSDLHLIFTHSWCLISLVSGLKDCCSCFELGFVGAQSQLCRILSYKRSKYLNSSTVLMSKHEEKLSFHFVIRILLLGGAALVFNTVATSVQLFVVWWCSS